ncbi:MAG: hypothetical protein ACRENP_11105, partial [Longimicrobiales bacterium]
MRDGFHGAFVILTGLVMALRVYWHVRAGTGRDRAAVRAGFAREGGFATGRRVLGPPTGVLILLLLAAPELLAWSELPFPAAVRWVGAALMTSALLLLVWVHWALGRNFNTTLVVRADPDFPHPALRLVLFSDKACEVQRARRACRQTRPS